MHQNCVSALLHCLSHRTLEINADKLKVCHVGTGNLSFSCRILGWMQEMHTGTSFEHCSGIAKSLFLRSSVVQSHSGSSRPSSVWLGILKQTLCGSAPSLSPRSTQKESIQSLLIALSTIQRLSKFLSVKYPYYLPEVITDACVNGYYRGAWRSHVAIV